MIANLSASNELVAKNDYRRSLVERQSGGCIAGYIYASAGVGESTTDMVFSGACTIAENGSILAENARFEENGSMITGCIDVQKLMAERRKNGSFHDNAVLMGLTAQQLPVIVGQEPELKESDIDRSWNPTPFIPDTPETMEIRCREIFSIQSCGLAKRLSHTGLKKAVIGISGGLDSTLALLVAAEAMKRLNLPAENILAVTMPGFGTTDRTYHNALELIASLGATLKEVDIRPACIQHMKDIGQDPDVHDITYENTQARQRTYILMDLANKNGGILVGTGDLSELAMGWCTYNGDHMSMYGVNASVPKTLVRHLVGYVASVSDERTTRLYWRMCWIRRFLPSCCRLTPTARSSRRRRIPSGRMSCTTFSSITLCGSDVSGKNCVFLPLRAFEGRYGEATVDKWLAAFYRRFFISQFKRSCVPDSPKVGSVSLSPRGDWRMPSDADRSSWEI